jgi:hypothetical protein
MPPGAANTGTEARFGRICRTRKRQPGLAPAAMAADGVGVYGRTDDKVVTFFAFGLIAFFAILVIVLSLIQIRLDNRKERRTQDLERLGSR